MMVQECILGGAKFISTGIDNFYSPLAVFCAQQTSVNWSLLMWAWTWRRSFRKL